MPLVSVLIRTMGRATLARSVAAAIAQTHRPLEVVIVNAAARPLPPLPPPGDVAMRVVDGGPYDRPRAANAAITHASGEWLVFLDDDDMHAPTHIEWLLAAAGHSPGVRVVYSATAAIGPDNKPVMAIGAPFNRPQLFAGNYIQMGAALFHASLVREGVRFDETLPCYEDWDFFIQLAQRTDFVFNGKPTNFWFAHAGQSGAGLGTNKREHETRPFHDKVRAKWAQAARMIRRD